MTDLSHIDTSFGGTWSRMKAAAEAAEARGSEQDRDDAAATEAMEQLKRAANNVLAQASLQLKVIEILRGNNLQKLRMGTHLEHGRFVNAHSSNLLAPRASFILDRSNPAMAN